MGGRIFGTEAARRDGSYPMHTFENQKSSKVKMT